MAWRDEMQKASFRGVPFHVRSSDGDIGRRNVVHSYPLKDEAYGEDLGKKAREFTLQAFAIGENYMASRDAFEEAIEATGPGELVHPWRGRMNVIVTRCTPRESIEEGGMVSWTVTFTVVGKNQTPSIRPDTYNQVETAADNSRAVVEEDFSQIFSVDGLPDFVQADALARISGVLDNTLAIAKGMLPDMSILPAFARNAATILGKLSSIIRLPSDLASSIMAQISGLLGLGGGPLAAFQALTRLFDFGDDESAVGQTTPSRIQQEANRKAINTLVRRTAVIEAARSTASMEFDSYQEAVEIRDTVAAALENEALTAPDEVFLALSDLRVAVIKDINSRGADLATLVPYETRATASNPRRRQPRC
jgi:prophage DNA circulation protein